MNERKWDILIRLKNVQLCLSLDTFYILYNNRYCIRIILVYRIVN